MILTKTQIMIRISLKMRLKDTYTAFHRTGKLFMNGTTVHMKPAKHLKNLKGPLRFSMKSPSDQKS